ncbi:MAG: hypothetical protein KAJ49_08275 [Arcobacteraceae bacterium]|nr:hypothetical protein [Arcobacteraceae bacterium]
MTNLLYASNEMFSSTQLIRKSKDIFDKLTSNEIEKAIILRDGKPNFMLLEFNKYEEMMKEYEYLKANFTINKQNNIQIQEEKVSESITLVKDEEISEDDQILNEFIGDIEDCIDDDIKIKEEEELKIALAQIEALNLEPEFQKEAQDKLIEKSSAEIKEFWN